MEPFEVYLVGGAVRDALLGIRGGDRDWVVVGQTPEAMLARGFRGVGRDFPVFLHPDTREEYALARTERKSGRGYRGFVVDADPAVTLEEDLGRRDFTINAIARRPDGTLVDPFHGARDLESRVLRHVGPAFVEDPLRVLRAARFMARRSAPSTTRKSTSACTSNWSATWRRCLRPAMPSSASARWSTTSARRARRSTCCRGTSGTSTRGWNRWPRCARD